MNSSEDESCDDVPDVATCHRLTEEFAQVTQTDTACAQFYLQDRKWDLEKSVSDYFEDQGGAKPSTEINDSVEIIEEKKRPRSSTDSPVFLRESTRAKTASSSTPHQKIRRITIGTPPSSTSTPSSSNNSVVQISDHEDGPIYTVPGNLEPTNKFKFITWNVDGLCQKNLTLRAKAVCTTILAQDVDVAFLQEIVPDTLKIFEDNLPGYEIISGGSVNYFTLTAIRKSTVTVESSDIIYFSSTSMGRNVILTKSKISKIPLLLLNTHLESTAEFGDERKMQLRKCFRKVVKQPDAETVIFAGDLNLRDKELEAIGGIPSGMEDVWQTCGSRKECAYTWDMTRNDNLVWNGRFKPKCRFDRVYLKRSKPAKLVPKFFGLIGLERLKPHTCFPSDHWGILCHFEVKK